MRQIPVRRGAASAGELRRSPLLLLGGAFAILLLLLVFGLHRLVVRPVLDLQRAASAVAEGRLDVPLTPRGNDEVARLVGAFAAMLAQLRASHAEVRSKQGALDDANARLESKVIAKTAQLQQALHELRSAQRELVLAERMASVGTLAGGIAHEFNNLAGGIRGCARELLAGEAEPTRRGVRHRQGTRRAHAARAFATLGWSVRRHQLRGVARRADRQ